jgi:hypothetical protein
MAVLSDDLDCNVATVSRFPESRLRFMLVWRTPPHPSTPLPLPPARTVSLKIVLTFPDFDDS